VLLRAGRDLPTVRLEDIARSFSAPVDPGKFIATVPARTWVQIKIPLREFKIASIFGFESNRTGKIVFGHKGTDAVEHLLIIDEIKIDDSSSSASAPFEADSRLAVPQNVSATGYERHIDRGLSVPQTSIVT